MFTTTLRFASALALCAAILAPAAVRAETPEGFTCLFNGKDLTGWAGNADLWCVEDGAITGQTTKEKPAKGNTFLIWQGGKPGDFELRIKFRMLAHNSGVQYRSKDKGNFSVGGYQADIDYNNTYTGMLYEEGGRGILVKRGTKMLVHEDGKKEVLGQTATDKEILAVIKKDDWNEYVITAKGNHLTHVLNGVTTMDLVDKQESKAAASGVIALQLHAGPPMKVQFKDVYLKELK